MSSDDFTTEMELYGVSPGIIAMIMFVISIVFPFGIIPGEQFFPISLIFVFVNPIIFLPATILNILFAVWIVRYYQAKSSKDSVYVLGILSVILPSILMLYLTGLSMVIYPIPIQFLTGIILLWKFVGPYVITPWSGMRLYLTWWKRQNPKRKSDWDPLIEDKKTPQKDKWLEE